MASYFQRITRHLISHMFLCHAEETSWLQYEKLCTLWRSCDSVQWGTVLSSIYTILPSICFCMFDWTSTVDQRQWNFLSALITYTASTYSTNKGPCLCTTLGFWRPSPQEHLINHRFTQDITRPWLVRNICQERRDPPGRDGRERMMWRSAPHTKVCQRPTRTNGPLNTNRLHIYWDHLGIPKLLANISGDYMHLYILCT